MASWSAWGVVLGAGGGLALALAAAAWRPDVLRHAHIRRVPYTALAVLAFFAAAPWLDVPTLGNFLTLDTAADLRTVALATAVPTLAIGLAFLLFHRHGWERFGFVADHRGSPVPPRGPARRPWWKFAVEASLTSTIGGLVVVSATWYTLVTGGLATGATVWLRPYAAPLAWLAGLALAGATGLAFAFFARLAGYEGRPARRARALRKPVEATVRWLRERGARVRLRRVRVPAAIPRTGYRDPAGDVYVSHLLAAVSAIAVLAANGLAAWYGMPGTPTAEAVPGAVFLLLAVAAGASAGSGLTFLADPSRAPLVLLLISGGFLAWNLDPTSHTWQVGPARPPAPRAAPSAGRAPVLIVATEGGGIQATSWTTAALAHLGAHHPDALDRLHLASGVSGGAVGLLFSVEAMRAACGDRALRQRALAWAHEVARRPSVGAVPWGVLYGDLLGVGRHLGNDRGHAVQWSWEPRVASLTTPATYDLTALPGAAPRHGAPHFSDWADGCPDGTPLPITVFATTSHEVGAPVLFSPWRLGLDDPALLIAPERPVEVAARLPDADVSLVTAARLSSAFPYIAPFARADIPACEADDATAAAGAAALCTHLADGGLYDNQGLSTVLDLLAAWWPDPDDAPPLRLLVLSPFPPLPVTLDDLRPRFLNALTAPLESLNAARVAQQTRRNRLALAARGGVEVPCAQGDCAATTARFQWHQARYDLDAAVERAGGRCAFARRMEDAVGHLTGQEAASVRCPGEAGDGPQPTCLAWLDQRAAAPLSWRLSLCEKAAVDTVWSTLVAPDLDAWLDATPW